MVAVNPARRKVAMTVFRITAMTCGDVPDRRTSGMPPRPVVLLVIASAATAERSCPPCGPRTARSISSSSMLLLSR